MKVSKILSKRALSLFIVGLFVFTAFAVIQSGGTNTGSIHSVSSPTSILPYTTTSNGLTYTVEPNGTYLWNGHYLRDPPVPYPKVPTVAPDGLPYGAVGPVGAQGHIGPYTFTKGTASIVGVSPATTAGTNTTINTNTYWNNETLTLVGNVSILSNVKLYINDSKITFDEPSSSVSYNYGFKLGSGTSNELIIQDGSVVNQSSPTTRGWSITGGTADIQNSTLLLPSPYYPGYPNFSSIKSCVDLSYFNYSTVDSFFDNVSVVVVGLYPDINSVSHSRFVDASVQINTNNWNNLSFDDSLITWTAASTHLLISYVTSSNVTDAMWHLPGGVAWNSINGEIPYDYTLTHDLFNNDNVSTTAAGTGFFTPGDQSLHNNLTISNVTITNMYASTTVGGGFFITSGGLNTTISHLSVINFTLYDGSYDTRIVGGDDNNAPYTTHCYVNDSFIGGVTMHHGSEGGLFGSSGVTIEGYYGDIFQNLTSLDPYKPLWSNGPFGNADDGIQIYGSMNAKKSAIMNNVWYININGDTTSPLQIQGNNAKVENVTIINVSNGASGLGVSVNSGAVNSTICNTNIYGVYNFSIGLGDVNGGGSNNTLIKNVNVYDVDTSSYSYSAAASSITFANDAGNWWFNNLNGTYPSGHSPSVYTGFTTKVTILNSTVTGQNLTAYLLNTANDTRKVLPTDYNFTFENSYISAYWLQLANNFSRTYPGSSWSATLHSNPSFLNLTGYLGIFTGQTYALNASNIKNEASLPIYYSGSEIAAIPASSAHYNFTAVSQSEYSVSTTSAASPSVNLYFHGIPGLRYVVSIISRGGLFKSFVENATSTGIVNATYNPATMPLDPTFEVSPYVAPSPPYNPVQPNPPMNFFPAYVFYILLATSAAGVAAGIYILIRRR